MYVYLLYLLGTTMVVESRKVFVVVPQLNVAPFKAVSDIRLPLNVRTDVIHVELPVVSTIIPTPLTVNDGIIGICPANTVTLSLNKELVHNKTPVSSLQV